LIVTPESSLIASTAMEAVRALADLVEISPQIEAAAVVTGEGEPDGSVGVPETQAGALARSVRELLDGAAGYRGGEGRVIQVHAELDGGELFAVTGGDERTIVAITAGRVSAGLLFYDLKRCLAAVGADAP
jgi:predicted regulator of Ras-like GTPase activity (Roadblock/LC7/MglB family)